MTLELLKQLQLEDDLQESLTVDSGLVDPVPSTNEKVHPKRKHQRSQRKKWIQSVSIQYDRPKTGPSTITPIGLVIPSNKERKLLWESSDSVETLHLEKLNKK